MNHGENIGRFTQAGKHHFVPKKTKWFSIFGTRLTRANAWKNRRKNGGDDDLVKDFLYYT